MEATVRRGHLEYSDDKGSYRIPIGRRTRKCMMVLDRKEGEYIRSLELDLFTGFVYYCVDNETSGGLSYYYDMSSKKVGHYFIHRYLRLARNHGFTCSPQEEEIFEKLPCANWAEEMGKLPGWTEAIENRMQRLLLPAREPLQISGQSLSGTSGDNASELEAARITFIEAPAAYPTRKREYVFDFAKKEGSRILHHLDDTIGNEFFGEDEEYDRILTEEEYSLITGLTAPLLAEQPEAEMGNRAPDLCTALCGLLPRREELVMEKVQIDCRDGRSWSIPTDTEKKQELGGALKAALRGFLRREIEIVE